MRGRNHKVSEIWRQILPLTDELFEHEKYFFPKIVKIGENTKRILEIGVGRGRMVKLLRGCIVDRDKNFYGIDLNPLRDFDDILFSVADTRELPIKDDVFDLTYSLGVVEHMSPIDTAIAVREHMRVTRPGGYVLISVPAKSILFTPLRYIVYFLKFRKMGTFDEVLGRNLAEIELIKHFTDEEKCEVLEIGRSGFYFPKLPFLLKKKIIAIMPPNTGAYLWILAQKN